jgi:hypothetical protein
MITNFSHTDVLLEEYNKLVVEAAINATAGNSSQFASDYDRVANPYIIIADGGKHILRQYVGINQGGGLVAFKERVLQKALQDYPTADEIYYIGTSYTVLPEYLQKLDMSAGKEVKNTFVSLVKNKSLLYKK